MKQRIFLINAHRNGLLMKDFGNIHFNVPAGSKYKILLDQILNNPNVEVYNIVTKYGCTVPSGMKSVLFSFLESKYLMVRNGYGDKIKTITDYNRVSKDDIVWTFAHVRHTAGILDKLDCKKYVMLNQFNFHEPNDIYDEIKFASDFIMEADIFKKGSIIYKYPLPDKYNFHLLPYAPAERFKPFRSFEERINRAVATGTLARCRSHIHQEHFGTDLCHKMRKVIFDNTRYLDGYVDSIITPYMEGKKEKTIRPEDSNLKRFIYSMYNMLYAKTGHQKTYFSINIVDKYNEYQMAVVPEELIGVPAIGAFECMACGTAMIGLDSTMYRDLGLIPGVHYISYDGTVENLKEVIKYYQINQSELKTIATNGCEFVKRNLTKENLEQKFLRILEIAD